MRLLRKFKKFARNQSGAAMIWAIIVFMVVSIASMTIISIQHADIREIKKIEDHLSAYYASLGGMELGLAALMSDYNGKALFSSFVTAGGKVNNSLKHRSETTYIHRYSHTPSGISGAFVAPDGAVAEVEVMIYRHPTSDKWVVVESTGKDIASGETVTNYLRVNAGNRSEVRRDGGTLANPSN